MRYHLFTAAFCLATCAAFHAHAEPADLVVKNGKVVTLDQAGTVAQALAVKGNKLTFVGSNAEVAAHIGPQTKVLDAGGKLVLPGLEDSHVHPEGAATSELDGPLRVIRSIADLQAYLREQAAAKPAGEWITLQVAFPTRLADGRLPTKAELDAAAPNHPVLYNAGPVCVVNSRALAISEIVKGSPKAEGERVVKDPETGEPTGLLRGAEDRLKGVPSRRSGNADEKRAAVKRLFALYNQHGITSVADKASSTGIIDLYRDLSAKGELTLRINCTRRTSAGRNRDDSRERLDQMAGVREGKLAYGPTGVGDEWVRIGPLKVMMDGGMLIGSAYMREPWGVGPTYQITDPEYQGILNQDLTQLKDMYRDAAARGWQLTAHVAGEKAMDVLLDTYEYVNETTPVLGRRMLMTHANFLSERNVERCKRLGVCADLQPAWLYKDGASLLNTLGERRMQWFLPFKTWLDNGLIVGGGSDHMTKLDPIDSINPWSPWLGIWITLTRQTERGGVLNPAERITREQALRMYTINNAYLGFAEKEKGSLEVGKFADVILVDRDVLTCPVDEVQGTKVLWTMVGGKLVWQAP